ncbi:MAG: hypothetical protein VX874_11285 [Pseudomonadota bacterium]|nr:hypothetical protein [Pseudomonadota bacterium]
MRAFVTLVPASFALSGCLSPFIDAADGYNAILNEISSAQQSADQLPTSGSATYSGHLLISAFNDAQSLGDFLGDVELDATFNAGGAQIAGEATNFADSATEEPVSGRIALTNGVLDRTASLINPDTPSAGHSFSVNGDGTLTNGAGDTFAFDTGIYGDVVGDGARLLTGQVTGGSTVNGTPARAGGTLVARQD